MLNLIKVELMKLKRRNKMLGIFVTFILTSATLIPMMYFDNNHISWSEISNISIALTNLIANIFLCILVGELFLDEYKDKTINIMFTYPISRTKIYFSKLFVILFYSIIILIVGSVCYFGLALTMNTFNPVLTGSLSSVLKLRIFLLVITCSITNTMFAVVYSFFATVKRSIPLMVTSCILLVNFTSNSTSTNSAFFLPILLSVGIICSLAVIPIINTLNKKDVIC